MRVTRESGEEALELLVQHRVRLDPLLEVGQLRGRRQLAVDQEVRRLEERRLLGKLLDRVAAVAQDACVPVDEGDRGDRWRSVAVAGVERHTTRGRQQLSDVDAERRLGAVNGLER